MCSTVADKARERKLALEEMQGGTFSISNQGGIGGGFFTPIINTPEVAILGMGRSVGEPVIREGKVVERTHPAARVCRTTTGSSTVPTPHGSSWTSSASSNNFPKTM